MCARHTRTDSRQVDTSLAVEESYDNLLEALQGSQVFMNAKREKAVSRLYIIGVSATGKTTLIDDLAKHFAPHKQAQKLGIITEVARELVKCSHLSSATIRSGDSDSMQLQRMILWIQRVREDAALKSKTLVLSDRSGIDPLVFAKYYGQDQSMFATMQKSEDWQTLRRRMQGASVVLCEPQKEWYREDGVRVELESSSELFQLHQAFFDLLTEHEIPFVILPRHMEGREARVEFVLQNFEQKRY